MKSRILIVLLAVASSAQVSAASKLENEPLVWKPTSELSLGTVQLPQSTVQFETFTDGRDNKQAIGENQEDSKPKPVTTKDDVGAYVSSHMRDVFQKAGIKTVDSGGAVIIKGEITRFFVTETNTYKGEIAIHLTVVSPSGKTLWNGLASGESSRFGRSYKLENYYETISDAVINTVSSMLMDPKFQAALSGSNGPRE